MSEIESARAFFEESFQTAENSVQANQKAKEKRGPRIDGIRTPRWDKSYEIHNSSYDVTIVPVSYSMPFYVHSNFCGQNLFNINDITTLCISRDRSNIFNANWISFFPDTNYRTGGQFSGVLFVEDWYGNSISKYRYFSNGQVSKLIESLRVKTTDSVGSNDIGISTFELVETCYVIDGYNYAVNNPGEVYYWSEPAGCSYTSYQDFGVANPSIGNVTYGSIISSNPLRPSMAFKVLPGTNIIANVKDYFKCFTNIPGTGYKYQVTVCVDQPIPGSRKPWGISVPGTSGSTVGQNPINVGHTFLIFTQTYGNVIISRNIGFYPNEAVSPANPSALGQYNNDDQHGYNISLSITVNSSNFFNMLLYLSENAGLEYNLNSNNCTSFAIHALYSGDIYLPSTNGTWVNGAGNNPGDFGEDVRSLTLLPNMIRNTYQSHPNLGNCN